MRRLAFAVSLPFSLIATTSAATDIDPYWLEAIPAKYHGRWNTDAAGCSPFSGRGRIEISGRRLVVGGDPFEADRVAWDEEGGVSIVSRYAGSAKPPWTRVDYFTLSPDGRKLVGEHARRRVVRIPCGAR